MKIVNFAFKNKEIVYNLGATSSYISQMFFLSHGIHMLISRSKLNWSSAGFVAFTLTLIILMAPYKWDKKKSFDRDIKIEIVEQSRNTDEYAILDRSKLDRELVIRKPILGDFFYPFGMKGKKKLSKYFKDEKYSLVDKEKQWLLCSGEKIVWVIGKRVDRRFAAREKQENPLILKLS